MIISKEIAKKTNRYKTEFNYMWSQKSTRLALKHELYIQKAERKTSSFYASHTNQRPTRLCKCIQLLFYVISHFRAHCVSSLCRFFSSSSSSSVIRFFTLHLIAVHFTIFFLSVDFLSLIASYFMPPLNLF